MLKEEEQRTTKNADIIPRFIPTCYLISGYLMFTYKDAYPPSLQVRLAVAWFIVGFYLFDRLEKQGRE